MTVFFVEFSNRHAEWHLLGFIIQRDELAGKSSLNLSAPCE